MLQACKLMRKFQVATFPTYVIQLAGKCGKGVYFNWAQYLCDEFLANVRESQDLGHAFCYSWFLFLIVLVTLEALVESILPELNPDMCEGARYTHLWYSKDVQHIEDNQVFWVLFQSTLATAINSRPRLSPIFYDKYKCIVSF